MSVRRELASGVFYTSIAKYAGIVVTLVVTGILSRLFTPEQFGVVNIATVVIAFFAIFSDLGIGPAVIQHKDLDRHDLGGIFSLSVWSGAVMATLSNLSAYSFTASHISSYSAPCIRWVG